MDGNYTSEIDLELDEEYKRLFSEVLPGCIYASEESGVATLPSGRRGSPEFIVIVDPLDTTELAIRGLYAHTHVLIYSVSLQTPILAVVGDLFHYVRAFFAFLDSSGCNRAFLKTTQGAVVPIRSSKQNLLRCALITNYSMRPKERFAFLAERKNFLAGLAEPDESGNRRGRIGVDFGSVGLCHVAAGFTDGMIEIAKGFSIWDLFPGQYILAAAGGSVYGLDGRPLTINPCLRDVASVENAMRGRQTFVAAGNEVLAQSLLSLVSD